MSTDTNIDSTNVSATTGKRPRKVNAPGTVPATINLGKIVIPASLADKFRDRVSSEWANHVHKAYTSYSDAEKAGGRTPVGKRDWRKSYKTTAKDFSAAWRAGHIAPIYDFYMAYATEAQTMVFAKIKSASVSNTLALANAKLVELGYKAITECFAISAGKKTREEGLSELQSLLGKLVSVKEDGAKTDFTGVCSHAIEGVADYTAIPGFVNVIENLEYLLIGSGMKQDPNAETEDDDDDNDDDNDDVDLDDENGNGIPDSQEGGFEED